MNILLIIMDSVQAKNTSIHNHYNNTTPFLEKFTKHSTFYKNTRSPSYFSLPSHASIFTGLHPPEHGANSEDSMLSDITIFDELRDDFGYKTGIFTTNPYLTKSEFGLNSGFNDIFDEYDLNEAGLLVNSEHIAKNFMSWSSKQTKPWAACINFMDSHFPYLPNPEYDRWSDGQLLRMQNEINNHRFDFLNEEKPFWLARALQGLYDGTIFQIDQSIKRICSALYDRNELENTLIIITSDHGEGFGEPSRIIPNFRIIAHLAGLHETLLHVPLCIKYPFQEGGRKVEKLSTTRKIYDVIKKALIGKTDQYAVCPDTYVRSYADLSNREALNKGKSTCLDGEMRAVYTQEDTKIIKYLQHKNRTCSVTIRNAQESMLSGIDIDTPIIKKSFEEITNISSKEADIDERTRQRLKRLGYL